MFSRKNLLPKKEGKRQKQRELLFSVGHDQHSENMDFIALKLFWALISLAFFAYFLTLFSKVNDLKYNTPRWNRVFGCFFQLQ